MDKPKQKKIIMSDITLNVFILARGIGLNLDLLESNLINLLILDIGLFYVLGDVLEGLLNARLGGILSELFRRKEKCSRSFRMASRAGKFVSLYRSDTWQTVYGECVKNMATKAKILAAKELFSNLPPYPKKLSPSLKKFLTTVPIISKKEWDFSRDNASASAPLLHSSFPYARYRKVSVRGTVGPQTELERTNWVWPSPVTKVNLPLEGASTEGLSTVNLSSGGFKQTCLRSPFPARLLAGRLCSGLFLPCSPEGQPPKPHYGKDLSVLADKSFEIAGLLHGRPDASTLNQLKGRLLTKSEELIDGVETRSSFMGPTDLGPKTEDLIAQGEPRATAEYRKGLKKSLKNYRLSKYGGSFLTRLVSRESESSPCISNREVTTRGKFRCQIVAPWCRFVSPDWSLSIFKVGRRLCPESEQPLQVPLVSGQDLYKPSGGSVQTRVGSSPCGADIPMFPEEDTLRIYGRVAGTEIDGRALPDVRENVEIPKATKEYFSKRLFDFMCSSLS